MRIASSCIAALAILVALAPLAAAQTAEAEMLFREGKRLMQKGKIAEACDKFEASERLEPEVGTELNLANCREKNGQTSSAWAVFTKAAANAKQAGRLDRAAEARRRASALEKQLIYLTIAVPDDSVVENLVIRRNQTSLDRELWNQAVPVDPGVYVISAEAPEHTAWSVSIAVKTKNKTIEVPKLERDPHHPVEVAPVETHEAEPQPARSLEVRKPEHRIVETPRKYGGTTLALGVIGAGALAIGTGFGIYSSHVESEADKTCPAVMCADSHAVDLNHTARTDGWIANISWGVGAVAIIGAATAWYLGRPVQQELAVVPTVSADGAGLALGGRF